MRHSEVSLSFIPEHLYPKLKVSIILVIYVSYIPFMYFKFSLCCTVFPSVRFIVDKSTLKVLAPKIYPKELHNLWYLFLSFFLFLERSKWNGSIGQKRYCYKLIFILFNLTRYYISNRKKSVKLINLYTSKKKIKIDKSFCHMVVINN